MIKSRKILKEYLVADSVNYKTQVSGLRTIKEWLFNDPISDQRYIWRYIVALRHVEYYTNSKKWLHQFMRMYWLRRLRELSYKTGFQIPPNTCGKGLTIWHWGG